MKYELGLKDKVIVVTGATGGIGSQITEGLLEYGVKVVAVDINKEKLNFLADKSNVVTFEADVTKSEDLDRFMDFLNLNFETIDGLVNAVGIANVSDSFEETQEMWQKIFDINVTSIFNLCRRLSKSFFSKAQKGKIVNICSTSAFEGVPNAVAYSSSKGALLQMTKSLAAEWAEYNIQVNNICPGYVKTNMIELGLKNRRWVNKVTNRTPMGRMAEPSDVVGTVLFLCSKWSDFITGSDIVVDGGELSSGI